MLAKKFALGFGLAIILPMMIHYGVSTFVEQPKWGDYQIRDYYQRHKDASPEEKKELQAKRDRLHDERKVKEKHFQKYLFFAAIPLGITAIIIGAFLPIQAIGTGLMFGGIFSVCDGYINYWSELSDGLRFISLVFAFIVLIVIGYKKLESKA
tara:strand:+ start:228 stop:686 length:459 start_codon:yes stop_codon:yes gene_type:complete